MRYNIVPSADSVQLKQFCDQLEGITFIGRVIRRRDHALIEGDIVKIGDQYYCTRYFYKQGSNENYDSLIRSKTEPEPIKHTMGLQLYKCPEYDPTNFMGLPEEYYLIGVKNTLSGDGAPTNYYAFGVNEVDEAQEFVKQTINGARDNIYKIATVDFVNGEDVEEKREDLIRQFDSQSQFGDCYYRVEIFKAEWNSEKQGHDIIFFVYFSENDKRLAFKYYICKQVNDYLGTNYLDLSNNRLARVYKVSQGEYGKKEEHVLARDIKMDYSYSW